MKRFDKNTQLLLSHVFQNNVEGFVKIIKDGNYDKRILSDVGVCSHPLPLKTLIACVYTILDNENRSKKMYPIILDNRKRCKEIISFWETHFSEKIELDIDFRPYRKICAHYWESNIKEVLEASLEEFVTMGYNKDEVELCYATLIYDYDVINKHIELGTNPDVYISANLHPGQGYWADGESYNALDVCFDVYVDFSIDFHSDFLRSKDVLPVDDIDIKTLMEGAAYYRLGQKFKKLIESKKIKNDTQYS